MVERAIAGVVLGTAIAWLAWRAGSLTRDGAVVAASIGALSVYAGWRWAAMLIVFFVSSSALTRWRAQAKAERTGGIVEKGGARDALQVIANGAVFAAAAALFAWRPSPMVASVGLGALASAAADTWGTEVGTVWGATPRFVLTGRRVAAGTSGAVSLAGTLATVAGAGAIAAVARLLGWPSHVALAAGAAGVAGAFADTILGATLQERRACGRCGVMAERPVHDCGAATNIAGGIPGFRNDLVNLTSNALGGLSAAAIARALG